MILNDFPCEKATQRTKKRKQEVKIENRDRQWLSCVCERECVDRHLSVEQPCTFAYITHFGDAYQFCFQCKKFYEQHTIPHSMQSKFKIDGNWSWSLDTIQFTIDSKHLLHIYDFLLLLVRYAHIALYSTVIRFILSLFLSLSMPFVLTSKATWKVVQK